jgi:hypothetical protein
MTKRVGSEVGGYVERERGRKKAGREEGEQ